MNHIRKTLLLAAALPLAAGAATVPANPANAAGCYGYSCHGLDPGVAQCAVSSKTYSYMSEAVVHNYYSKACNANWASAGFTQQGYNDGDSMAVVITTTDSQGHLESMCYPGPSNTGNLNEFCYNYNYRGTSPAYTDMVDGTNVTQAIAYIFDYQGNLAQVVEADQ